MLNGIAYDQTTGHLLVTGKWWPSLFEIRVVGGQTGGQAPIAGAQSVSTSEDSWLPIVLTASDADGDPLTFSIVNGPAHGTLSGAPPTVTYSPAANYYGSDSFTFKANDGTFDSEVASVSIMVTPINDAPVAASESYTTGLNTALTVPARGVLGNDSDVEGNALTAILVSGPSHGVLTLNANGSFTYTPSFNYSGADSFVYAASDGLAASNTATVSLTVTVPTAAPQVTLSPASLEFRQPGCWHRHRPPGGHVDEYWNRSSDHQRDYGNGCPRLGFFADTFLWRLGGTGRSLRHQRDLQAVRDGIAKGRRLHRGQRLRQSSHDRARRNGEEEITIRDCSVSPSTGDS